MKRHLFLLMCFFTPLVHAAEEHSIITPDGRVRLFGPHPRVLQEVAVWAVRGVRNLEREAGQRIPHQENIPLMIRFVPDLEKTRLLEELRGPHLWQEIQAPASEEPDAVGLADMYTRAALNRLLWQAAPGPRPQTPDWLVMALSHVLLDDLTSLLLKEGLSDWRAGRLPSPTQMAREMNQPALSDAPLRLRAHAWLSFRFLTSLHTDNILLWERLGRSPRPGLDEWLQATGNRHDLRDLHIAWDLWLSLRDRAAIADLGDESRATRRLEEMLLLRPAEFGLAGEAVPRYEILRLPDLTRHLREPWLESLLQSWMVRAHLLRFRQPPEFLERVDDYVRAAGHLLEANRSRGRRREESLLAFEEAFQAAEIRRPVSNPIPAP